MSVKVAHVVRQYTPSVGGMEEVVRSIAADQLKAGQRPRVITLNRLFRNDTGPLKQEEEIDGVSVTRLPYSGSSRYPLCPSVLRELGDADVVHVHGVDFFYDYLAATKTLHGRPLLLSTHGGFFHTEFASRLKDIWFRTVTRASAWAYDRIVATSENDGRLFERIVPASQLEVIENGVDTEKYADCSSSTLTRTMIYFGRWSANKGLLDGMDLLRGLIEKDPRWQLTIAGREYDYQVAELAAEVRARGLEGHVRLEANPSADKLRDFIRESSYFLCLSRHEGFGLAAIEAMSAGLTPLLSDIPPFRRLVDTSHLGLLLGKQDQSSARDGILELHDQGAQAAALRRTAAMEFAAHYSWSKVAKRYFDVYEELGQAHDE